MKVTSLLFTCLLSHPIIEDFTLCSWHAKLKNFVILIFVICVDRGQKNKFIYLKSIIFIKFTSPNNCFDFWSGIRLNIPMRHVIWKWQCLRSKKISDCKLIFLFSWYNLYLGLVVHLLKWWTQTLRIFRNTDPYSASFTVAKLMGGEASPSLFWKSKVPLFWKNRFW